jgi:small conductance mechanosensitive channel
MQEQLFGIAVTYGPRVLVAALMLLGGYFAGHWAAAAAGRSLERYQLELPLRALLGSAARVLVFGLFLIMALQNIGVELLPLIAGLGVAGAAVALAMQGVLGNVAAGLTIIFSKPFRVGDYVSIVGVHGEVLEIRLSSTTLGHADLSRVVVPNRKIVGEILHNYGGIRQLAIEVTIPYEADVDDALDTARAVLRANSRVLRDPIPGVGVARLVDTGVTLSVTPWVAVTDYGAANGEINQALLAAFRNRKIVRESRAHLAA